MILEVCPACHRQYDVGQLDPGAQVRCLCGELMTVAWRSPLATRVLSCAHCGGGIAPGAEACGYCGREVARQDRARSTLCPACRARLDDDSSFCRKCGTEVRPQTLHPLPRGWQCPRCAGELAIRVLERASAIDCRACGGLWLETACFERICRDAREDAHAPIFREVEAPRLPPETFRYIPCLRCGELMLRRQFRHAGRGSGVVLDCCKDHGVWLDAEELERVVTFVREAAPALGVAASSGERSPEAPARRDPASVVAERPDRGAGVGRALEIVGRLFLDLLA